MASLPPSSKVEIRKRYNRTPHYIFPSVGIQKIGRPRQPWHCTVIYLELETKTPGSNAKHRNYILLRLSEQYKPKVPPVHSSKPPSDRGPNHDIQGSSHCDPMFAIVRSKMNSCIVTQVRKAFKPLTRCKQRGRGDRQDQRRSQQRRGWRHR